MLVSKLSWASCTPEKLSIVLATDFGSADDRLRMNKDAIYMGEYGLPRFMSEVLEGFLWNESGDCTHYEALYLILRTFCTELNKTLSNMRKTVSMAQILSSSLSIHYFLSLTCLYSQKKRGTTKQGNKVSITSLCHYFYAQFGHLSLFLEER